MLWLETRSTRNTCLPLLPHRHNAPHAGWQQREKRPIKEKPLMVLRRAVLMLCDLSLLHTHTQTHTHPPRAVNLVLHMSGAPSPVNQTLNEIAFSSGTTASVDTRCTGLCVQVCVCVYVCVCAAMGSGVCWLPAEQSGRGTSKRGVTLLSRMLGGPGISPF